MFLRGEALNFDDIVTDAPKDLNVVCMVPAYDNDPVGILHSAFALVVESETFLELAEGADIPFIDPFKYERDLSKRHSMTFAVCEGCYNPVRETLTMQVIARGDCDLCGAPDSMIRYRVASVRLHR